MFASKKIVPFMCAVLLMGSWDTLAISKKEQKKIDQRKAQRAKEKTKGVAKAKPEAVSKSRAVVQQPVQQQVSSSRPRKASSKLTPPTSPAPVVKTAPAAPMKTAAPSKRMRPLPELPMPTDMPPVLERNQLLGMLPSNLKSRVDAIFTDIKDPQLIMRNIYLLGWVDNLLMQKLSSADFYAKLLAAIAQEYTMPYDRVEQMASQIKGEIDSALTNYEDAIIAGDNLDTQAVRDQFRDADSYPEYLERCLRLAQEHKRSKAITVLKLAIANAKTPYSPASAEDFNY